MVASRNHHNPAAFIQQVRQGAPGSVVRDAVQRFGHRELFADLLNTSPANLNRHYKRKALGSKGSEKILDTLQVLEQAATLWGTDEDALDWLETPVAALGTMPPITWFDTFEGRNWVRQVLCKIETGDFS